MASAWKTKGLALAAVGLGLWWGLAVVQTIVHDRQLRQNQAHQNVSESLSGPQALVGPTLTMSCVESWPGFEGTGAERKAVTLREASEVRVAPRELEAILKTDNQARYRGLFKVNGYSANVQLLARFDAAALQVPASTHAQGEVRCALPRLAVSLGDARGIQSAKVTLDDQALQVRPGDGAEESRAGLHAELAAPVHPSAPLKARVDLVLLGTSQLSMAPIADNQQVTLTGDWPHPAFGGSFLPTHRDVGKDGFKAQWQLSSLATSAQREWLKGARACGLAEPDGSLDGEMSGGSNRTGCVETFGVTYIDPVNPYVLSDRASKYGLVFIVLTFVAVGLTEVLRQLRVHPVQYLLVGAGLTLFFLLLVSLSEHIGFLWAYGIASGACTLLLGFYGVHTLRSRWGGVGFGAGIATLFGVMFVLLQREQTALVLGSVMLFVVLALVMVLTRHVDWYELMERLGAPAAPAGKEAMPAGAASQDAEETAAGARR